MAKNTVQVRNLQAMIPSNLIFLSISHLRLYRPHNYMHSEMRFCKRYSFAINFFQRNIFEKLNRKETSIPDDFYFIYEEMFLPVENTSEKMRQCNAIDALFQSETCAILSASDQFLCLQVRFSSVTDATMSNLPSSTLNCQDTFFQLLYIVRFTPKNLSWWSFFSMPGKFSPSVTVFVDFFNESFQSFSEHDRNKPLLQPEKEVSFNSNNPTHLYWNRERIE